MEIKPTVWLSVFIVYLIQNTASVYGTCPKVVPRYESYSAADQDVKPSE